MKIYILGVSGMLGSQIFLEFQKNSSFEVRGSIRKKTFGVLKIFKNNIDEQIDVRNINKIEHILNSFKPNYVINCIGFVKQKISKKIDVEDVIYLNSLFPHKLFKITSKIKSKLIHFSTDCVFNGLSGNYSIAQLPNAIDLYGQSKILGEINRDSAITIRTSIIGHEIQHKKNGLLEWFLKKKNNCKGYACSFFSGLTTLEVFNFIQCYISNHIKLYGIIHLSSKKISKYDLLKKISKIYKKKIIIKKFFLPKIDRSLKCNLNRKNIFYKTPTWNSMIKKMYDNQMK